MDDKARKEISAELDIHSLKRDPSDTLPFNRPRLAWCSEEFFKMEELDMWVEKDYVRVAVLSGHFSDSQWIRPGWRRCNEDGEVKFPTFMKSIPHRMPPPHPAGIQNADWEARQRWETDQCRFPPYQYICCNVQEKNFECSATRVWRWPHSRVPISLRS